MEADTPSARLEHRPRNEHIHVAGLAGVAGSQQRPRRPTTSIGRDSEEGWHSISAGAGDGSGRAYFCHLPRAEERWRRQPPCSIPVDAPLPALPMEDFIERLPAASSGISREDRFIAGVSQGDDEVAGVVAGDSEHPLNPLLILHGGVAGTQSSLPGLKHQILRGLAEVECDGLPLLRAIRVRDDEGHSGTRFRYVAGPFPHGGELPQDISVGNEDEGPPLVIHRAGRVACCIDDPREHLRVDRPIGKRSDVAARPDSLGYSHRSSV
jgi:hypothetical protein